MSNEDVQSGDFLALDKAGNLIKAQSESVDDVIGIAANTYAQKLATNLDNVIMQQIGVTVQYPGSSMYKPKYCSYCKVEEYTHNTVMGKTVMNHSFFNNNLEYLEWENGRRETDTSK